MASFISERHATKMALLKRQEFMPLLHVLQDVGAKDLFDYYNTLLEEQVDIFKEMAKSEPDKDKILAWVHKWGGDEEETGITHVIPGCACTGKRCTACKSVLCIRLYYKNNANNHLDGLAYECKTCADERKKSKAHEQKRKREELKNREERIRQEEIEETKRSPAPTLYTTAEIAHILHVHVATIHNWIRKGTMTAVCISGGKRKKYLVSQETLECNAAFQITITERPGGTILQGQWRSEIEHWAKSNLLSIHTPFL